MTLSRNDIVRAFRRQQKLLIGSALCGLLSAFIYLFLLTPEYTAAMVVGPVVDRTLFTANAPPTMTANMQPATTTDDGALNFERYVQLLTSTTAAARVLENVPDALPTLFPDEWDATHKSWVRPYGFSSFYDHALAFMMRHPVTPAPDAARLAAYVKSRLMISQVGATKMRSITLRHADRGFAITLLYALHQAADSLLRGDAVRRADAITGYIDQQLPRVQLAEHRLVLSQLLASQERLHLMAAVNLPFAADIIEEPTAATTPDWPEPWPILMLGTLIGFMLAAGYVTWRISKIRR